MEYRLKRMLFNDIMEMIKVDNNCTMSFILECWTVLYKCYNPWCVMEGNANLESAENKGERPRDRS